MKSEDTCRNGWLCFQCCTSYMYIQRETSIYSTKLSQNTYLHHRISCHVHCMLG